jgi:FkbM family methyltransferase
MDKLEIKNLLGKENPIIFEIGANDGGDTFGFLRTFRDIKLYCFEPDRRAISKFKTRINKSDIRCKLYEVAIGNINGTVDFYESSGNPGNGLEHYGDWDKSGSIKKPKNHITQHEWCKFNNVVKVDVIKLDTFIENNDINFIDFIWADVQGAEEDMILGGLDTLNSKVKYLYTEVDYDESYEGAATLDRILELLPNFEIAQQFECDVLLINKKFK